MSKWINWNCWPIVQRKGLREVKFEFSVIRRISEIGTKQDRQFNVLLSVHHAMILGNCPTWRKNSFQCIYLFIYSSLHVSSMSCSSSGETNCINTASGKCHSCKQVSNLNYIVILLKHIVLWVVKISKMIKSWRKWLYWYVSFVRVIRFINLKIL